MSTSLSVVGLIWASLSFVAAAVSCLGYFIPYWLTSNSGVHLLSSEAVSFGSFRKCGYPHLSGSLSSNVEFNSNAMPTMECGRYATFYNIPSIWWQVTTVVTGVGCCSGLLVAFAALACCCVGDIMSRGVARTACAIQVFAGICIAVGCALYPLGWDNEEVKQACGETADRYNPGKCTISWAYWTTAAGGAAILFCTLMACHSSKRQGGYQRAPIRS